MKHPKETEIAWSQYHESLKEHDHFIKNYKFFLERICNHLKFVNNGDTSDHSWSVDEIRSTITSEIHKCQSMDAPNEPGYYRANND